MRYTSFHRACCSPYPPASELFMQIGDHNFRRVHRFQSQAFPPEIDVIARARPPTTRAISRYRIRSGVSEAR